MLREIYSVVDSLTDEIETMRKDNASLYELADKQQQLAELTEQLDDIELDIGVNKLNKIFKNG